jgi:threonine aldolase
MPEPAPAAASSATATPPLKPLASDNWSPAHPAVLAALAAANEGPAPAYGSDPWTEGALARFRELLGDDVAVLPVFNGTAANVLCLEALLRPHEAVICAESAHIANDECGAPERHLGSKLLTVPAPGGKVTPDAAAAVLRGVGDEHHVQPRVVSVSQSTELGTVYAADELRALADWAHAHGLLLHVDGARIANAAAALGLGLREATRDLGVDALSFGGTKNGALGAEAVVLLHPELAAAARFQRKQAMQLASKQRYAGAQLAALLEGDLWLANARQANAMAQRLATGVSGLPGLTVVHPVQANAVFVQLPAAAIPRLQARAFFHVWDATTGICRWMTAWDTSEADVDAFVAAVRDELSG